MKVGFVKVFVADLTRALDYYTRVLGMELDYTDGKNWAQFKSGEDVSLALEVSAEDVLVGRFVGVTLMVDDIAGTYARLAARGVPFTGAPKKQPWGGDARSLQGPGPERPDTHGGGAGVGAGRGAGRCRGITAWGRRGGSPHRTQ